MSDPSHTIVLKSADGALFRVSQEEIKHSILLRNIIGDNIPTTGETGESIIPEENTIQEQVVLAPGEEPIPLANVTGPVLAKVIEWLRHHKGDPVLNEEDTERSQEKAQSTKDVQISDWDTQFINVEQGTLFEIILAADYLDIRALLDIGCKTVANMLKGKTPDEIRAMFNIENDFTKEEEEKVRKENEWCNDVCS